jgi:hypothetical protein
MRDFIEFVGGLLLALTASIVLIIGVVVGGSVLSAQWNCRAYHAATGEPTRVIAAECFVQRGGEWVIYDAAVNPKRVQLEGSK